ncbi:MAG: hypothetical protein KGK01_07415 [Bradyrhizobium sp.]|uniref:hypothetical protein n=1 Tax=Bradyrhizobium sp. TaxID=376 RepID=UPI001C2941C4|nr:hypothetical protein [Bradyrhizobium sp.]MBU6461279.1 hypothetical protein [Pseudomonadota bacterium]MDE2065760.1 hypothetical protein [Bradyrhizobium sp.]MDE2242265.1 hypothetical protein [Bradyrhizobium sp.]
MSVEIVKQHLPRPAAANRFNASVIAWTAGALTIALAPLLFFPYPGLQDYPNHLARAFILLHRDDPVLQRLYSVQWTTLPNLGWDIWAMAVGRFLPLAWTGKLFIATASLTTLAGCFALNRIVASRLTIAPLLAVPLLFNAGFARGFLGFELGCGCALLAAAWWVSAVKMHWLRRLFFATACSTALYFVHLYAWAFYGLFVFGYEIQRMIERKSPTPMLFVARLVRDSLQALPVPFMLIHANQGSTNPEFTVQQFQFPFVRVLQIENLISLGNPVINFVLVVAFALVVGIAIVRLRWIEVRGDFAVPIAISILLFFLLPDQIAGTFYVAWRVLFLAILVFIASCVPTERGEIHVKQIMVGILLLTFAISCVNVQSWHRSELGREDFLNVIHETPEGSALFVLHSGMKPSQLHSIGLYHVGAFAVLAKRALVQSIFTKPGQQPLRFHDQWLQPVPETSFTFLADTKKEYRKYGADLASQLLKFDYVVVDGPDFGDDLLALSQSQLAFVKSSGDFRLYKVEKKPLDAAAVH